MVYHRNLRKLLLFYKANYELIQQVEEETRQSKSHYDSLQTDVFMNSRDYQEETVQRNLEYLVYQLQNPNPKVGLSYSVLASRTYEFLPEALTVKGTQTERFKKAKGAAHKRLRELFTLANINGADASYLEETNSIKFVKGSIAATFSVDVYMVESPVVFWVLLTLEHSDAKWAESFIIKFNNMIGNYLNSSGSMEELSFYYFIVLELYLYHETNLRLLAQAKNTDVSSIRVVVDAKKDWFVDLSHVFPHSRYKLQLHAIREFEDPDLAITEVADLHMNHLGSFENIRFRCYFGVYRLKDKVSAHGQPISVDVKDSKDISHYLYSSKRMDIRRPHDPSGLPRAIYSELLLTVAVRVFKMLNEAATGFNRPELHVVSSLKQIEKGEFSSWLSGFKKDDCVVYLTVQGIVAFYVFIDIDNAGIGKKFVRIWYTAQGKTSEDQQNAEKQRKDLQGRIINSL